MSIIYKETSRFSTGETCLSRKRRVFWAGGLSLLEVLIAIVVLGVGFLGTGELVTIFVKKNSEVSRLTTATTLIQDKIEEFKRMSGSNFSGITSGSDSAAINSQEGTAGGVYTRTWTVTTSGSLKTIVVTVSWTSFGQTKSKSMTTAVSQ